MRDEARWLSRFAFSLGEKVAEGRMRAIRDRFTTTFEMGVTCDVWPSSIGSTGRTAMTLIRRRAAPSLEGKRVPQGK